MAVDKSIQQAALNILARREHSEKELRTKLEQRFPDADIEVSVVIEKMQALGYQSDDRFTQAWLRMQLGKLRGPKRILAEARLKGVYSLIESALETQCVDWAQLAFESAHKKFSVIHSPKEQAKLYRFLSYRGFSSETISQVVSMLSSENDLSI